MKDIDRIEITLDGTLVETITPDQLVNGPLGLQYTGTVSGLDASSAAQNPVKATVYLSNGTVSGEAESSDRLCPERNLGKLRWLDHGCHIRRAEHLLRHIGAR